MTTLVCVLQRWLEADFVCIYPSRLFLIKYLTSSQPRILFLSSFILLLQSQGADFPTYGTVTSLCAGFGKMLLPQTWDRIYGSRTGVQDLDFNLSTYSHFLSTSYLISGLHTPVYDPCTSDPKRLFSCLTPRYLDFHTTGTPAFWWLLLAFANRWVDTSNSTWMFSVLTANNDDLV